MIDVSVCSGASRWMFSFQPSFTDLVGSTVEVTQAVTTVGAPYGPSSGPVSWPPSGARRSSVHASGPGSGLGSGDGEWVVVKGQNKPSLSGSEKTVRYWLGSI